MNRRMLGLTSAALVVAMGAAALAAGSRLPADIRLPVHWNFAGEPDAFAGKWVGLLTPAGVTAGLSVLFWFLPMLEPRSGNLFRSHGLYLWGWAAILLLGVAIETVVLSVALGWGIPVNRVMVGACSVIFMMVGNQLAKSRSMYLIGLRTPWTLASEEVWMRANRLAGKLMVLGGLVALFAALLPLSSRLLATIVIVIIATAAIIPLGYSFLLWRREPKRAAGATRE